MFKYKSKAPKVFKFSCRRCHVKITDIKVTRYCGKCEKLVNEAKASRQWTPKDKR